MVHFPAEILHGILLQVDGYQYEIYPMALVSRHWRDAVESIRYKETTLTVYGRYENATTKSQLFWELPCEFRYSPRRKRFLRGLEIHLLRQFPDPFPDWLPKWQTSSNEVSAGDTSDGRDRSNDDGIRNSEESFASHEGSIKSQDTDDYLSWNWDDILNVELEDTPSARFRLFRRAHFLVLDTIKHIWEELLSWGDALSVSSIHLVVSGRSHYELLGDAFQDGSIAQQFFPDDRWLESSCLSQIPLLPSVTRFSVASNQGSPVDLWPQVVACQMAHTLPCLESLYIAGDDYDRSSYYLRKYFRECKY
ncbi:hypothetical protein P154DRAFT_117534 [Amniculicola lignicola CBS 123094]|uniref:F-box domain-containing protein n=1 Tax=Amniculicola lignicola CBS 123094 TaxID=1392246 RepID=A0A6A5X334_9PLEO|nr:hypothetical protein P154DRAFT_117534 [Amniculicola lignicola CBS 123094]